MNADLRFGNDCMTNSNADCSLVNALIVGGKAFAVGLVVRGTWDHDEVECTFDGFTA